MWLSDNRVMVGSVWLYFSVMVDACFYIFLLKRNRDIRVRHLPWICSSDELCLLFTAFAVPLTSIPQYVPLHFVSILIFYSFKKTILIFSAVPVR
jgi:hypothetical protein